MLERLQVFPRSCCSHERLSYSLVDWPSLPPVDCGCSNFRRAIRRCWLANQRSCCSWVRSRCFWSAARVARIPRCRRILRVERSARKIIWAGLQNILIMRTKRREATSLCLEINITDHMLPRLSNWERNLSRMLQTLFGTA
ncbi:hypothetical protein BT96DRAFT_236015 [Gymnopus androsaceus JB14]|uniref:Uncharacterized protein n=1 Tax=Gymnopus androsaceus JB14 TaxID=1447944 RepID=A0A6A4IS13_9AGAR|nr:hypothetical protein BT96DRAFT_236015 [Gymnopus androsaceus JB14]